MFYLVLHDPMIGYANSYDMVRAQYCLGWWPVGETTAIGAHPDVPYRWYQGGERNEIDCYKSSALLPLQLGAYAANAVRKLNSDAFLSLQWMGFSQALLLTAIALVFAALLWKQSPVAAAAHAGIYAVLITDPINTLYINTWYYEFGSLIYLYGFIVLISWLALRYRNQDRLPSLTLTLLSGVLLFCFGMSKMQNMPLALLLVPLLLLLLPQSCGIRWWAVLAVSALLCIPAQHVNKQEGSLKYAAYANITNVVNRMILGEVQDPASEIRALNLPERCIKTVGLSWHDMDLSKGHPCPEMLTMTHLQSLGLLLKHPEIWIKIATTFTLRGTHWNHHKLGHVEGMRQGKIHNLDDPLLWSVSEIPVAFNANAYLVLWLFAFAVWLVLVCVFLMYRKSTPYPLRLMLVLLTLMHAVLFVSVMGDGYQDVGKHNYFANQFLVLFYLGIPWVMIYTWRKKYD
jgi:hypothetical protein